MTEEKVFTLNFIPIPEGEFGPEVAKRWMESNIHYWVSATQRASKKNGPGDVEFHHRIKEDTATMVAACSEVIASGKPVEFGRSADGLIALFRPEILDGIDLPDEERERIKKLGLRDWLLSQAREPEESAAAS